MKKCKVPGCEGKVVGRGLCNKHYIRERKGIKNLPINERFNKDCFLGKDEGSDYFLGVLYGDGWIASKNNGNTLLLGLKMNDEDVLRQYGNYLNLPDKVKEHTRSLVSHTKATKYWSLEVCCDDITNRVMDLGLSLTKSKNQLIPKVSDTRHFLRGLMDSDGIICKDGRVNFYITGEIVEFIESYLVINNIKYSKRISYKSENVELTQISILTRGKNNIKFLDLIYKDSHYYMGRKYQKYLDLL